MISLVCWKNLYFVSSSETSDDSESITTSCSFVSAYPNPSHTRFAFPACICASLLIFSRRTMSSSEVWTLTWRMRRLMDSISSGENPLFPVSFLFISYRACYLPLPHERYIDVLEEPARTEAVGGVHECGAKFG